MYSYNIEHASRHRGNNIDTVTTNETRVYLDGTLKWPGEHRGQVLSNLQAQYRLLPSWGPAVDADINTFVDRLAY